MGRVVEMMFGKPSGKSERYLGWRNTLNAMPKPSLEKYHQVQEVWAPRCFPTAEGRKVMPVHHSAKEGNPPQICFGGLHQPTDLCRKG